MKCPWLQFCRAWCVACLGLIVPGLNGPLVAAIQFTEVPTSISNVAPGTVAWGDYDSDGRLDVFVTGQGVAAVWRNAGGNVFTLAGQGVPGWDIPFMYFGAMAWGDWDNDGDLDAMEVGHDAGVSYYAHVIHNFSGVLRQTYFPFFLNVFHPPAVSSALAVADTDNDGVQEVLVAGQHRTRLYHFTGLWSELPSALPDLHLPAAAWADYDQDGDMDVLVSGSTTNGSLTALMRNVGGGVFADSGVVFPALTTGSAAWGDFDNDGDPDLLLTGLAAGLGPVARIYRNDGGAFVDIGAGLPGVEYSRAAWGDFDNDGRLDLVMAGRNGGAPLTRLYRNLGNGSFSNTDMALPQVDRCSIAVGDYDNDGALDLILSGMTSSNTPVTRLLRNLAGTPNTPPAAPTGLQAIYSGSALTLNWAPAVDAEQTNGLTYNVRIGTASGTGNVFSAMSLPANGRRLVPQPGNAGQRLSWTITNLTGGDYHATVQAIDHGLAGSAFAGEVTVTRPVITTPVATQISLNTTAGPLAVTIGDRETLAESLALSGASADTNLVPDSALVFGGLGSNRTVSITPRTNLVGTAVITLHVADDNSGTNTTSFLLTVTNPPPVIAGLASLGMPFHTTSPPVPFVVGDFGTVAEALLLSAQSSDTNLVPLSAIQFAGSGSNRTVTLSPWPGLTGASLITVTVTDSHGGTDSASFTLSVTNPPPAITDIPDQFIPFNSATPPLPFTVGDFETPAAALVLSAHSSNTNLMPVDAIVLGGAGSNRTVTLTPRINTAGVAIITITVQDASGATSSDSFVLAVTNQPPVISPASNVLVYPGDAMPPVAVIIGDAETPAHLLVLNATAATTNLVESLSLTGSGSNRVLQVTPRPATRGTDTIRLVVTDSAGGSATNSFTLRISEFAPVATGFSNLYSGGVAWGDFDNDGWLDVLIYGRASSQVNLTRLMRNNGDGTFAEVNAGLPGLAFGSASWGDYDNDGRLDLLMAANPVARLFRNLGGGAFSNVLTVPLPGQSPPGLAWGDYDNDGDLDFVLTGGGVPHLYRNEFDRTFTNINASFPNGTGGAAAWGDGDGDGDLDLALAVGGIFRNDGGGMFAGLGSVWGSASGPVAWADADNDGDLDLLVTGQMSNLSRTVLARNLGSNTFSLQTNGLPPFGATAAAWGDYDQDGFVDMLLAGGTSRDLQGAWAGIFRNNQDGTFSDLREAFTGVSLGGAAWGDFDGDRKLDVLYCGLGKTPGTFLYRNLQRSTNAPPSPPSELVVLPDLTLSWRSSSDAEAVSGAGLTYNLRIGTAPGAADVLASHSDLSNGARRMAAAGNVGPGHRWRPSLPLGIYYWSVQSVDAAFVGSAWAVERVVAVPGTGSAAHLTLARPQDGQMELRLTGVPYERYRVESSSNLVHWSEVVSGDVPSNGVLVLFVPFNPPGPRFLRARVAP